MNLIRVVALVVVSMCLTACSTPKVPPPEAHAALPKIGAPDLRGATVFAVDPGASVVHVHVFRGGTLARLGHNHVMTSNQLSGRVWLQPTFARSGFELEFPVAQLVVDDPRARAAAGSEFPGEIPAEDREGTRNNMLRAEVLDAGRYPTITLQSVRVAGDPQAARLTARITIKGVARDVEVPAVVQIEGNHLTASGEFDIRQSDFGIKPFTIGMGALAVQDRLHVVFRVVATRNTDDR